MSPWVWDQVGLELCEVNIEGSVKSKRGGDRGDDLGDKPIEVLKNHSRRNVSKLCFAQLTVYEGRSMSRFL